MEAKQKHVLGGRLKPFILSPRGTSGSGWSKGPWAGLNAVRFSAPFYNIFVVL